MARSKGPSAAAIRYHREHKALNVVGKVEKTDPSEAQPLLISESISGHDVTVIADKYPHFGIDNVAVGKQLGRGGVCTIWEVSGFHNKQRKVLPRDDHTCRFLRSVQGKGQYVIKQLNKITSTKDTKESRHRTQQGLSDLKTELYMLDRLSNHPNILRLRAIAVSHTNKIIPCDMCLILDRLHGTLDERLNLWKKQLSFWTGILGRANDRKGVKKAALYRERVSTAYQIATALNYIHSQKILFRDLKPDNIGYDIEGNVKIFDFGLAKDLSSASVADDSTYHLTAMSGSPRYMAPEVAKGLPYNASCDVYSFSILFWQILTVREPFEQYTMKALREKVYEEPHKRPPIEESIEIPFKSLLKASWSKNLLRRPSMKEVAGRIIKQRQGEEGTNSSLDNVSATRITDERDFEKDGNDPQEDFSSSSDAKRYRSQSLDDVENLNWDNFMGQASVCLDAKRARQASFEEPLVSMRNKIDPEEPTGVLDDVTPVLLAGTVGAARLSADEQLNGAVDFQDALSTDESSLYFL